MSEGTGTTSSPSMTTVSSSSNSVKNVSGEIEGGHIMAQLHFAIRAYAVQGDGPAAILGKLGRFLDIDRDQSFATILCALVDVPGHAVTLVNAGHPPLLLLQGKTGDFVRTSVFPPVGVDRTTVYEAPDFVVQTGPPWWPSPTD